MILSFDTINTMKPPYDISPKIMRLVASIAEMIGRANVLHLEKPSPELRRQNRIKTIQASLEIEGNTLNEEQITALLENKHVLGPKKDIQEVLNAIAVYEQIGSFKPAKLTSFLKAHAILMKGLIVDAGKLRTKGVGIAKGQEVTRVAPPASNLHYLINELFDYLANDDELTLIKSCVVHYELEFIHPFMDGNGRMGRLWQTRILMEEYPIFEFLPFETIIKNRQEAYYQTLAICDKTGKSTLFIEFMLEAILAALEELITQPIQPMDAGSRMAYFQSTYKGTSFTRKDYLQAFKEISTATASRDIKQAMENGFLKKEGDKRTAKYYFV